MGLLRVNIVERGYVRSDEGLGRVNIGLLIRWRCDDAVAVGGGTLLLVWLVVAALVMPGGEVVDAAALLMGREGLGVGAMCVWDVMEKVKNKRKTSFDASIFWFLVYSSVS